MATRAEREAKEALNKQHQAILSQLLERPDNQQCADCKNKDPRWASWNLGIFMCIDCSGVHRSIGTHITRVKSTNLDTWTDEQIVNMQRWGNARANAFWEANQPPSVRVSSMGPNAYIRAKYERREWAPKGPVPVPSLPDSDSDYAPSSQAASSAEQPKKKKKDKKPKADATADANSGSSSEAVSAPPAAAAQPKAAPSTAQQQQQPAKKAQVGNLLGFDFDPTPTAQASDAAQMPATGAVAAPTPSKASTSPAAQRKMPSAASSTSSTASSGATPRAPSTGPNNNLQAMEDMFNGLTVFQPGASGTSNTNTTTTTTTSPPPPASTASPSQDAELAAAFSAPQKKVLSKDTILSLYVPGVAAVGRVNTPPVFASNTALPPSFNSATAGNAPWGR